MWSFLRKPRSLLGHSGVHPNEMDESSAPKNQPQGLSCLIFFVPTPPCQVFLVTPCLRLKGSVSPKVPELAVGHGSRRPFHPGRLTSQVVWFSTPVRQFCSLKGGFKPARQLVSTPARRSPLCRSSQRAARPCRRPLEVETAAPSIHSDTRNPPTRLWVDQ